MKYPVPFGRHLLLERINVGGMAEVFKAKAFGVEGFERIVAVKRILPTMAEDEEFVTMFVDEARIASHLAHQNIVQIYELGRFQGNYYISMEYVAGRDLRQILDQHKRLKKPMEVAKACYVTSRVCEALEYAHRKKDPAGRDLKIIHRDVSPQNVIISFEGEVKLCDFGIAKAASRASRTQVGVLKGKFAYMSPEQVRGQAVDRRSDIFALGVIFYEMLTGERLFLGESDYSTLEAVRNARVPPPTQFNQKIPPELEKIMLRLLARDPKDRYQWASEVHEDLLDHLVVEGKIYHGRHLRTWMQESYAREIEIENAKLEDFMRLKLPEPRADSEVPPPSPSPVVLAMASEDDGELSSNAPLDESDDGAPTGQLPIVRPPQRKAREELVTGTTSSNDVGRLRSEFESAGSSPIPNVGTASPVSSLFGAPQLDGERGEGEEPIVRPAGARAGGSAAPDAAHLTEDLRDEPRRSSPTPSWAEASEDPTGFGPNENPTLMVDDDDAGELERTQWDVPAPDLGGRSAPRPVADDARDTLSGDAGLAAQIRAAQAELIEQLDARGGLDGETIDASDLSSDPLPSPQVLDPSEAAGGPSTPSARRSLVPKAPVATRSSLSIPKVTASKAPPAKSVPPALKRRGTADEAPLVRRTSVGSSLIGPGAMEDQTALNGLPLSAPPAASPVVTSAADEPRGRPGAVDEPRARSGSAPLLPSLSAEFEFDEGTIDAGEAGLILDDPEREDPGVTAARPALDRASPDRPGSSALAHEARSKKAGNGVVMPATPDGARGDAAVLEPDRALGPARVVPSGKRRIWEVRSDEPHRPMGAEGAAGASQGAHDGPTASDATGDLPARPIDDEPRSDLTAARPLPTEDPASARPRRRALRDPRVLMLSAAGIGAVALALLVGVVFTRGSTGASLHIVTEPIRAVEVRLDGKVIGAETPVEATALGLGLHTVELRAAGYQPYTQVVQISEAKPHTMVVPLEPAAEEAPKKLEDAGLASESPTGDKTGEVAPKTAEKVGLTGSRVVSEIPGAAPYAADAGPETTARPEHPVKTATQETSAKETSAKAAPVEKAAMKSPTEKVENAKSAADKVRKAGPQPAGSEKIAEKGAPVEKAAERSGEKAVEKATAKVAAEKTAGKGASPASTADKGAKLSPKASEKAAETSQERGGDATDDAAKAEKGSADKGGEAFLVIATKPAGVAVTIDGKKTNLHTPIRHPYAVSAGKHTVTFELTDGTKYSFDVSVAAGETKKLVKQLR